MEKTFDNFSKEKSDFLRKKDKSKKGRIDKDIARLVKEINSKNDYCTTSSCSGRIVLLEKLSKKKNENNWVFCKHDKVKFNEIIYSLKKYQNKKNKNEIWFKQEPIILHICCRNMESAKKMLDTSRRIFRRTGIIGISDKKIMIEIIGSERIDTIISNKNFIADGRYVQELVKAANSNYTENKKKIGMFLRTVEKI